MHACGVLEVRIGNKLIFCDVMKGAEIQTPKGRYGQ